MHCAFAASSTQTRNHAAKGSHTRLSCVNQSVSFLRMQVGDLLGEVEPRCLRVLDAFTRSFDFRGKRSGRAST